MHSPFFNDILLWLSIQDQMSHPSNKKKIRKKCLVIGLIIFYIGLVQTSMFEEAPSGTPSTGRGRGVSRVYVGHLLPSHYQRGSGQRGKLDKGRPPQPCTLLQAEKKAYAWARPTYPQSGSDGYCKPEILTFIFRPIINVKKFATRHLIAIYLVPFCLVSRCWK